MIWFLDAMIKYAVFQGRARRKAYWMFLLFVILISFFMGLILAIIQSVLHLGVDLAGIANIGFSLAILIPSVAIGVRRMHDIGRSGWRLIVPFLGWFMLCMDSQPGENKYGPNPKTS
ncbi:DUF805 domain-containing protein [Polaromonas naphthalenivorans]|uniref:DUF805 domain-containing protein n=1 Tax=Polaromonas naphthalenivorans (strain CJ2) TaxID=365044 RepID=A1VV10_POLNA|nr:DUF805 domain-containing protein [Polaromonas naphthalenivorans]ABM39488.1 protein of unknown function DUF805 [Polaromonas naphthalenivorans CJ2]